MKGRKVRTGYYRGGKLELSSCEWAQWNLMDTSSSVSLMEEEVEQKHHLFDNRNANCDFDKVEDQKYHPVENFLHGDLALFGKEGKFAESKGYASQDGKHYFKKAAGCTAYFGWEGRARCIALPQCKAMNSLVRDDLAKHKVLVRRYELDFEDEFGRYRNLGISPKVDGEEGELPIYEGKGKKRKFVLDRAECYTGWSLTTHLPFDDYAFAGCLLGKASHVQRAFCNNNPKKVPSVIWVSVEEVFETLNPGHKWSENRNREEFANWCEKCAEDLNLALLMDLPYFLGNKLHRRKSFWKNSLKTDAVRRGRGGQVVGFKFFVQESKLFDFCFVKPRSPRVVQISCSVLNTRRELGAKSTKRALHTLYAAWLVYYRNYWITHGMEFPTCKQEWSVKEMDYAFRDCHFKYSRISLDCMAKILNRFTVEYHEQHPEMKWNACIGKVQKVAGKSILSWELPKKLRDEEVYAKDAKGETHPISEVDLGNSDREIAEAWDDLAAINSANSKHVVTRRGMRVRTKMSAVARVDSEGKLIAGKYLRNYTHRNGFQSLKSKERLEMKIDGRAVCELDFSALHPTMLYAMSGIDFSKRKKDFYDLGDWYTKNGLSSEEARKWAKQGVLTYINARKYGQARGSLRKAWNAEHGLAPKAPVSWITDFEVAMGKVHRGILGWLCSGIGTKLQYMDGKMMRKVCLRLSQMGICALPVHDSGLVAKKHAAICRKVMQEEYSKMMGGNFSCEIKCKER